MIEAYQDCPIKVPFVETGIMQDFLSVARRYERLDLISNWDRAPFYVRCLSEMEEKRRAKILKKSVVREYDNEILRALNLEPRDLQEQVSVEFANKKISIKRHFFLFIKKILGKNFYFIQPFLLRLNGAKHFGSALHAAGFFDKL